MSRRRKVATIIAISFLTSCAAIGMADILTFIFGPVS